MIKANPYGSRIYTIAEDRLRKSELDRHTITRICRLDPQNLSRVKHPGVRRERQLNRQVEPRAKPQGLVQRDEGTRGADILKRAGAKDSHAFLIPGREFNGPGHLIAGQTPTFQ